MVLINATLEQMLEEIKSAELFREDRIVPSQLEGTKTRAHARFLENSTYAHEVLLPISKAEEEFDDEPTPWPTRLYLAIHAAIENAMMRGNGDDISLPIFIKYFVGQEGIVVQIKDSGPGFDFEAIQQKYLSRSPFAQGGGIGFRSYNGIPNLSVSFENGGNTINLMYKPSMELVKGIGQAIPK
jgi:anti-sigma regulatory factor (Ser/Thr protein kinase)